MSDVNVFVQLEIGEMRDDAEAKKKDAELSGIAKYYESLIKILDQLGTFVKPGQFCDKDRWFVIEKRIGELAQKDACGGHADITNILQMLSLPV